MQWKGGDLLPGLFKVATPGAKVSVDPTSQPHNLSWTYQTEASAFVEVNSIFSSLCIVPTQQISVCVGNTASHLSHPHVLLIHPLDNLLVFPIPIPILIIIILLLLSA